MTTTSPPTTKLAQPTTTRHAKPYPTRLTPTNFDYSVSEYDSEASWASSGSSYSSPSVDPTQYPPGMEPRPANPQQWILSGLIWTLFAATLPAPEQQYHANRDRPPGVMQPIPNIPALMEYNDNSPDNISLSHRLRNWRSSGSSWTLYISTLPRKLHKWYINIPPARDDTYIQHPSPPPIPTVRTTSLHLPRITSQPASNQSDLEGYHPSASASKHDGNQPTAPHTRPIDAAFINNPYLPGRRKAPAQPKRTRLPHTDRRAQPAPKQRKPTSSSEHNQDPVPID